MDATVVVATATVVDAAIVVGAATVVVAAIVVVAATVVVVDGAVVTDVVVAAITVVVGATDSLLPPQAAVTSTMVSTSAIRLMGRVCQTAWVLLQVGSREPAYRWSSVSIN